MRLNSADLLDLVNNHSLQPHCYADDTRVYGYTAIRRKLLSFSLVFPAALNTSHAVYMFAIRLQFNTSKTENLLVHHIASPSSTTDDFCPGWKILRHSVFDSAYSWHFHGRRCQHMSTRVMRSVSNCFGACQIKDGLVPVGTFKQHVTFLVLTRLDYMAMRPS